MRFRLEQITVPVAEPVTLDEAKSQLHEDLENRHADIDNFIKAAREETEKITERRWITQQWRIYFDSFYSRGYNYHDRLPVYWPFGVDSFGSGSSGLELPQVAPVQTVDSVKYIDENGTLQTLAGTVYQLIKTAPAKLVLAFNQS